MTRYNSLYRAIEAGLRQRGGRSVILWDGGTWSGLDILDAVDNWAAALSAGGISFGDRLAVQAENSVQLVLIYLAALKMGAVYVPLNTAYTRTEVGHFLDDCQPAMFVCGPGVEGEYVNHSNRTSMTIRTLGRDGDGTLNEAAGNHSLVPPFPALSPNDLAAIVYTSGTTGRSKGAMISNGNLLANATALIEAWEIGPEDVLLHSLPLFHIHGLFVALNTALIAGACVDLHRGFDLDRVLQHLPDATLFMGVPTYYTRLLSNPRFDRAATHRMRVFISGSAPLSMSAFEQVQARTGHTILERYGMTECGIICSNPLRGERTAGAVGSPLPGVSVRLSTEGLSSESHGVGVLEVSGPSVFHGYWQMPERTTSEFRDDGYFITGDLATIDQNGTVRLVGRAKDLIISGGLNIYAKEVETAVEQYDGVKEAAVIGLPHPDFGEAVAAVISMQPGQPRPEEREFLRILRKDLAGFKVPKLVFFVDEIPRNAMGKIQKAALRERYNEAFYAKPA